MAGLGAPPAAAEAAIIGPTSELIHRVEFYEADGITPWDEGSHDDCLLDGSVTVDYDRTERRAFDITLDNGDGHLVYTPGEFWYDKILKIFSGVRYYTSEQQVAVRSNLCPNPSFETNTTGWSGVNSTLATSTVSPISGSNSLRIVPSGGSSDSSAQLTLPTLQPNRTYTVSATIHIPTALTGTADFRARRIYIAWQTTEGGPFSQRYSEQAVNVTGNTQRMYVTFTTPSKLYSQEIRLYNGYNNSAANHVHWDAVLVEETDSLKDYFDGSTLDYAGIDYTWNGTANASTSVAMTTSGLADYNEAEWDIQVGEFMIDHISQAHFPPVVKVTGRDYTKKCITSKFTTATTYTSGTAIETAIKAIAQAAGISKFVFPLTGHSLGTDYMFERGMERWQAMNQIASAFGYELFFNAIGELVLREYADPVTSAVSYTLETGYTNPLGTLVSYEKSVNDTRLYNHVVVSGETNDSEIIPVSAEAINTEPSSPTRVSQIGDRVYEYVSPFITTETQAQDVADKFLKIHSLEEYDVGFTNISLPWLEVGEIVEFIEPDPDPGQPTRFLLSNLTIPLGLDPMAGNAKRVAVVG